MFEYFQSILLIKYAIYSAAPDIIVYDNACNLHNYALNRDPVFFKDSTFVVDRFHWPNHRGKQTMRIYM